jgi:hypothetical protein
VCSARSSAALPARHSYRSGLSRTGGPRGHRDGPAQAVGHDRGDGARRAGARRRSLRHRQRWLPRDAPRCAAVAGARLAVEGCSGMGRHVATRLLGDGEQAVDVPPKLSARARVFSTGQGRNTGHRRALRRPGRHAHAGLRPVVDDEQLAVLRVLADRRRVLGEDRTRIVAQLHHLLLELIPGGAKKDLSAAQAEASLTKVRPRDAAGQGPPPRRPPSSSRTWSGSTPGRRLPTRRCASFSRRRSGRGRRRCARLRLQGPRVRLKRAASASR